ncbi:Choline/ethanolamine kinase [Metamycoplasma arthritidis]|uniref:Protein kinase domain-containing protein n=1 Tax=Metamycoplasma arthritidis (strain 158L3-1) TaxID=243272 RepID=B3PND1_META1|nr:phosphotransferase [Metamycoplasma arthritidis]ACF07533.1 conserved hypothetical protein [Metamycoplasma arthritidis 158L3-1]VEU79041.1 Choline/ethanolamine kinase [Metamycoplasma arthritidis]
MKEEIGKVIEDIEKVFGKKVANSISNVRFFHEGFHSKTYIGKLNNETWVQIRIPKHNIEINYANEELISAHFKNYLHVKDGYLIKRWFPGQDLFKLRLDDENLQNSIMQSVESLQKINVKGVTKFDWLAYNTTDKKYLELVKKYENEGLVLAHNNIKRHNVLVNKQGYIKLIDFEFAAYNSRYTDPVTLHLFLGIDKQKIVDFFNLDSTVFDDYVYLIKMFSQEAYKHTYAKLAGPSSKIYESLAKLQQKDYTISNRFIIQKYHNQFDNRLDLKELEAFYFVPACIYEDNERIIWKWLSCHPVEAITIRQMKVLAYSLRTLHDSNVKFPSFILKEKVAWYIKNIDPTTLLKDMGSKERIDQILEWINKIEPDANCHNDLSLNNIFFTDNFNLYIVDWSVAYRNNRLLDIAFMLENTNANKIVETWFWKTYGLEKPKDFYKYQIIAHFVAYLYNRILTVDYSQAEINIKRIKEIFASLEKRKAKK